MYIVTNLPYCQLVCEADLWTLVKELRVTFALSKWSHMRGPLCMPLRLCVC